MPDYTMCKGSGCLLSLKCKRYLAEPSMYQSYFTDEPFRVIDDKTECDYFWEVSSDLTQLKETNGERGIGETDIRGIEKVEQRLGKETESGGE